MRPIAIAAAAISIVVLSLAFGVAAGCGGRSFGVCFGFKQPDADERL